MRSSADVRSAIHTWRSTARLSLGDLLAALNDAEEALQLARSVDDPDALADALTALVAAQVWLGQGIDRTLVTQTLELEASTEPRPVARRPSVRVAHLLARTGEIDESRSMCTSLLDEAVGSGDDDAGGRLHAELGWVEFLAGDWVASLDHLRRAVVSAPAQGSRLGALALVEAHRGEADAAQVARDGSDGGSRAERRGGRGAPRAVRARRPGAVAGQRVRRSTITSSAHGSSIAARASGSPRCSRSSPITRWR